MKIFSGKQIHEWDAFTIANEPITSVDLMERAAQACTNYIRQQDFADKKFKIFCGKGNNGGDGLAIARQLISRQYAVDIYIIEFGAVGTEDFQINLQRLHALAVNIHFLQSQEFFPEINDDDLIIDALYGSGLSRPLKELSAALVKHINQCKAHIISIDVPSGMFIDKSSKHNAVVKAGTTLTFQCYKLCFLVAENAGNTGDLKILDIGLSPAFINTVETTYQTTEGKFVHQLYKPRLPFSHKGTFGHALIIAGSRGKMGAALMATHACLRAGAGLTTVNVPEQYANIVHTSLPEAMCSFREDAIDIEKINAIGIGPGLGTDAAAKHLIKTTLEKFQQPLVIDADALNVLSTDEHLLSLLPADSILTPHPKEFERLFGSVQNDFERMEVALQQSEKHACIIVLKGRYTLIACKGKGYINTTGNAGLAKGGSGDILTGIITALLAQKYPPAAAAILGVYLHGLAADITLEKQSEESMLAGDVIANTGAAFSAILNP